MILYLRGVMIMSRKSVLPSKKSVSSSKKSYSPEFREKALKMVTALGDCVSEVSPAVGLLDGGGSSLESRFDACVKPKPLERKSLCKVNIKNTFWRTLWDEPTR
jgi:hypothetical protein